MTMADTIAVMQGGKIVQLGDPVELYENPRTTFVANFLGTSNLLPGRLAERRDGNALADVNGERIVVPQDRNHASGDRLFVGIRPEKLHVADADAAVPDGHNRLHGVIVGASFTGIGTQSQVRLDGGQQVSAFVQNLSAAPRPSDGTRVVLHWEIAHTFALDGREDAAAGDGTREDVVAEIDGVAA